MRKYKVAVLGATGAVGQQMIKVLGERKFPIDELRLLASERSAGSIMDTPFGKIKVEEACDSAFKGMDIVLGAAENDIAKKAAHTRRAAFCLSILRYGTRRRRPGIFFSSRVAVMASKYTAAVPRMRHSQLRILKPKVSSKKRMM